MGMGAKTAWWLMEMVQGCGLASTAPPSPAVQQQLDADLFKTIHAGRQNTAMGSWSWALPDEEAQEAVAYLRTLRGSQ